MFKRVVAFLLSLVLLFAMLPSMIVTAEAYDTAKPLPTLSGNLKKDFLSVAKSQKGYLYNGGSTYGAYYGNSTGQWCAYFVSWCARKAGVPKTVIPDLANAGGYWYAKNSTLHYFFDPSEYQINEGLNKGVYCTRSSYTPKEGDLIFLTGKQLLRETGTM